MLVAVANVFGQESPTPAAISVPEVTKSVPIRFIPPPLEGTISLGIYDATGKLVRVLHREADLDEFKIGSDALNTTWDGKDDTGAGLPAGKYHARGFVVGDVGVDGIGFFFNDFVTDEESPHLLKIHNLKLVSENEIALLVTLAGGAQGSAICDLSGDLSDKLETAPQDERFLPDRYPVRVAEGKLSFHHADSWDTVSWPDLVAPLDAAAGKDGTIWVIDRTTPDSDEFALKQFSAEGSFLRQMLFPAGEPQPKIVTASTTADKIFLLEENAAVQRVRGLSLVATNASPAPGEKPVSDWNVDFEKEITAHQRFAIVGGRPMVGPDPAEINTVTLKLRANPLEKDASATIEIGIGYDAEGSFVKTSDGLPLQTVSETPHLMRVALSRNGENSIDVFQDDAAVVEQFRITALDQMMAFDCGEIELK